MVGSLNLHLGSVHSRRFGSFFSALLEVFPFVSFVGLVVSSFTCSQVECPGWKYQCRLLKPLNCNCELSSSNVDSRSLCSPREARDCIERVLKSLLGAQILESPMATVKFHNGCGPVALESSSSHCRIGNASQTFRLSVSSTSHARQASGETTAQFHHLRKVPVIKAKGGSGFPHYRGVRQGYVQIRSMLSEADAVTPPELDMVTPLEAKEELSQATLIWRAIKLPIYSVALVPLTVGAAAACLHLGVFNWGRYWLLLWSSVLVITWLNLSNDAYDAETGVDKDKKESVVNMTGSQRGVLGAAYACLALGFTGLVRVAQQAGDPRVTYLLTAAILCGYVYQCPPFRLSYKGLGEPLCFMAFGPFATTAFYLSQASGAGSLPVTLTVMGVSVLVGITTSLILFCSHFHQIEGDLSVGKMSPLVRLGTEKGSKVVQTAVVSLYSLIVALTLLKALPLSCTFFSMLTLPIGRLVLQFIGQNHANEYNIFMAKYYCVRLHVALGTALVLGLLFAPMLPAAAKFW